MYSPKRQFGNIGEDYVVKDLESKGHQIIARNYLKKWGEIDIVTLYKGELHFVEVKSVKYVENSNFRPEDNMHFDKLRRLQRTCETFLLEHKKYDDLDWQIDLVCAYLIGDNELKKIEYIENLC